LLFGEARTRLQVGFGLENDEREAFFVEQEEVDESFGRLLEILSQIVESLFCERNAGFKLDVRGPFASEKNRQLAASSILLILIRAAASFIW
jgi:hypothetical protein